MDTTAAFEQQRPRLVGIATRVLGDHFEAEDVVQQTWLRLRAHDGELDSIAAWLTTVTTRLCLDRLRARRAIPTEDLEPVQAAPDAADDVALAETVGLALQVVLERLTPQERVAFVLHDSFGVEFTTIAAVLDSTPAAARKLASRARAKVGRPAPDDALADWEVVDIFLDAARNGRFERLLELLAPDASLGADAAAIAAGTPQRIQGQRELATFFNGAARAALSVFVGDRPAAAWYQRGEPKVLFDFTIIDARVAHISLRADADALAQVVRRDGPDRHA